MIMVENAFDIGAEVYLKHDPDQFMRMVIRVSVGADGALLYGLASAQDITWHYELELSQEKVQELL